MPRILRTMLARARFLACIASNARPRLIESEHRSNDPDSLGLTPSVATTNRSPAAGTSPTVGLLRFQEPTMTKTDPILSAPVIRDRRRELRVKIKSLAQEARIIRAEERRCRDSLSRTVGHDEQRAALAASYVSLRMHRVNDVRRESRHSLLAYALIRGRNFRDAEKFSPPMARIDVAKLVALVKRFGSPGQDATVSQWLRLTGPGLVTLDPATMRPIGTAPLG